MMRKPSTRRRLMMSWAEAGETRIVFGVAGDQAAEDDSAVIWSDS